MKSRDASFQKAIKREGRFFVYIVQCRDGTYYTGSTNNIDNRVKLHNKGHGAKYLRGKLPVKLVYAKEYHYYKNVLRRERDIKKMTRKQKEKLIANYKDNNRDSK